VLGLALQLQRACFTRISALPDGRHRQSFPAGNPKVAAAGAVPEAQSVSVWARKEVDSVVSKKYNIILEPSRTAFAEAPKAEEQSMTKLIKYLRPYVWWILLIVLLLFGQAMADLSLPTYMSKIVNVGIQNDGIQNALPKAIRATELDRLTLFMNDTDNAEVSAAYTLVDESALSPSEYASLVKKYPLLATSQLYVLQEVSKSQIERLNHIFESVMPVVAGIELNSTSGLAAAGLTIPEGTKPEEVFDFIAQLPADNLTALRSLISEQSSMTDPSLLKQYSIAFVSAEYKAIGVDLGGQRMAYMWHIGLIMLVLAFAGALASVTVGLISARIAAGLGRDLRRRQFERVESFSAAEFDQFSTASLITRSTNDITQIQMLMVMLFRFVFYAPILGIGAVVKVTSLDRSMLWIIAAVVSVMIVLIGVLFFVAIPRFRLMQKLMDRLNLVTREFISGLMVIRAFNTQETAEKKFDVANVELTDVSLFVNRVMAFLFPMMMLIMNGTMLLIIWVGAHQVDRSAMQVGDMMATMQYTVQIIFAFIMISMVFIMIPRASVSAVRVTEVIDTEPSIKDPVKAAKFKEGLKGVVEFQDVSFRYPGAEEDVLKHVSFTAKPGQTTAFIGSTGSGKSTLVNMILRFYDAIEGRVLVDGMDVRDVTQHDLRDKIGYVPQQAVLFSGTIESNIKYGNQEASRAEVEKFADIAQATEFISTSDKDYATAVAQGGANLSGGQKQRLSIARALAKKPEIFIFDDSFSALDFKTDVALRKALKQETGEATVLIVTQRVGQIMGADQIVVLEDGRVAGVGTHLELMKDSEVYREIALSQLSKEELSA
jgi:ATP-binding cassette subfamily B multidrug efflux pump